MTDFINTRSLKLRMDKERQLRKQQNGLYVGIDPGTKGGVSLIEFKNGCASVLEHHKIPQYKVHDVHLTEQKIKKNKAYNRPVDNEPVIVNRVRFDELLVILQRFREKTEYVCVEDVYGYFNQSADYAFTFGFASGGIFSLLVSLGFSIHKVSPDVWKRNMKVPSKKDYQGELKEDFEIELMEFCKKSFANFDENSFIEYSDFHKCERYDDGQMDSCLIGKYCGRNFNSIKFTKY